MTTGPSDATENRPRILVTGASGFIGRSLVDHFKSQGYLVSRLVRDVGQKSLDAIYWNPIHEEIPLDQLEGFYGIVHLAGENIGKGYWTKAKKESIFLSRVRHTWLLSQALTRLKRPPKVFFSASAIGYYGDRGDEILTEESRKGDGFLSDLCAKWEEASQILDQHPIRVLRGRFGVVLSPKGGLLAKILPLFRWGVGSQLGTGRQWVSWISLHDLLRIVEFILFQNHLQGTFNCVAPTPVTQAEFTHLVARSVHRKPFFPVPAWVLKSVFGEKGKELFLASTRVIPKRLWENGFSFETPTLEQALNS